MQHRLIGNIKSKQANSKRGLALSNISKRETTFEFAGVASQSLDVEGVGQPQVHLDERFAPLQTEVVPRFGFREQLTDGALRQRQHSLPEQLLTEVVVLEQFLHFGGDELSVEGLVDRNRLEQVRMERHLQRGRVEVAHRRRHVSKRVGEGQRELGSV